MGVMRGTVILVDIIMTLELLSDKLKQEIKKLLHEVLDERELERKLKGPYDFPEEN